MGVCAPAPFLGHHRRMATPRKSSGARSSTTRMVSGRSLAKLGQGVELVKVGRGEKPTVRRTDAASVLVRKAAKALKKPGIAKSVVFRGPDPSKVYAFSVLPSDPTRIVRKASDGTRVVGRFVNGKFRASKA